MAKSPKLIAAVADIVSRDPESLTVAMRRLREAKLVEVAGKGRGGKDMTARDAAMLLLAASGGATLKDSPASVASYWNLVPSPVRNQGTSFRYSPERPLNIKFFATLFPRQIGPLDSFGVALTAIIQAAKEGPLLPAPDAADWLQPAPPPQKGKDDWWLNGKKPYRWFHIKMLGPRRRAEIQVSMNDQWTFQMVYGEHRQIEGAPKQAMETAQPKGDYLETREFSIRAIERIGESLR